VKGGRRVVSLHAAEERTNLWPPSVDRNGRTENRTRQNNQATPHKTKRAERLDIPFPSPFCACVCLRSFRRAHGPFVRRRAGPLSSRWSQSQRRHAHNAATASTRRDGRTGQTTTHARRRHRGVWHPPCHARPLLRPTVPVGAAHRQPSVGPLVLLLRDAKRRRQERRRRERRERERECVCE
jgi:hypothetical protein